MANEITITFSLSAVKDGMSDGASLPPTTFTLTGKIVGKHFQTVGITEEALEIGDAATLGWCAIINRDPTNYVEVRSATGAGNDIIKIPAGAPALFYFGSDVTVPYVIANTAACKIQILLLEV